MNKLRKKLGLTVLCASLLVLAPSFVKAASYGSCDPCNTCNPCECCDPCDCWGDFEFGADFLYWKPCVDDLDYAAEESSVNKHFKYRCICPEWEPGFRVYFGMPDFYCDWGLSASWTYIESDDSGSVKDVNDVLGILLHPHTLTQHSTTDAFDEAKAHWDADYHEWEVLFSTDLSCKECHHFMPFFGVAGIFLDQCFSCDYYDGNTKTFKAHWDSDLWGVGFRAGTEYQYRFSECLSFFTKAAGTILYSEADNKHKSESVSYSAYNVTAKDDDCCHLIPGWHLGTGFTYDTCYCDWDFSFRLGYEFLQWCNIPNHRNFGSSDDAAGHAHASSNSLRTFGFHGLFAGLGVSF
ncbi:MAG: Lpg1974 family pore-forming outer membrane protein [Waddliaceae bacterium]